MKASLSDVMLIGLTREATYLDDHSFARMRTCLTNAAADSAILADVSESSRMICFWNGLACEFQFDKRATVTLKGGSGNRSCSFHGAVHPWVPALSTRRFARSTKITFVHISLLATTRNCVGTGDIGMRIGAQELEMGWGQGHGDRPMTFVAIRLQSRSEPAKEIFPVMMRIRLPDHIPGQLSLSQSNQYYFG